jgi:hypothetical protein
MPTSDIIFEERMLSVKDSSHARVYQSVGDGLSYHDWASQRPPHDFPSHQVPHHEHVSRQRHFSSQPYPQQRMPLQQHYPTQPLPARPGKFREGDRLPTGLVDPMATSTSHPLGHHGLREHLTGMTKLDVEKHGRADNPTANWRVLDDIQNLAIEGQKHGGGNKKKGPLVRHGKIREGDPLPTGVVDPMATSTSHPLGHHGLRQHLDGMTRLDVERHGRADSPAANWMVLDDIQKLAREGKDKIERGRKKGGKEESRGEKKKGGGPESRRSKDDTHGPR